ncbi:MAG: hypothetical protein PHR35_13395, partial [Kiritimatiellae bacterium]|nr:hypothetical protein [Kiritimatiellia bacterium]
MTERGDNRRIASMGLVFVALAALILSAVPPWAGNFFTGLPDHWDPPLHAWKLIWNAGGILQGHLLLPRYHANAFYPHMYVLCFDDLFWIPSYLAAALRGCGAGMCLTYNAVMLVFWALSGVLFYRLLREIRLQPSSAFFGAAVFCLA